ncbi:MAG: hypothetical protein P1V35_08700 [Planctomycetota bacterium]|nr:hypothetical protein [Planctomycetota bacterium]
MKSCYSNMADRASYFRVLKLLPVLLLPIGLMGVTAPSYLGYRADSQSQSMAERGSAEARQRKAAWEALGPIEDHLNRLRRTNHSLMEMIPEWQEEIMAHGAIRKAAEDVGLTLDRIMLEEPVMVTDPLRGQVIVERSAVLTGMGGEFAGLRLVEELRTQGWPVVLHSLDLDKATRSEDSIQHALTLGLFHYADAAKFQITSTEEETSQTAVEAKIQ